MNPKVLHKISYGLYIVSSKSKDKINGQIANSIFQVTSEPRTIAISINKQNLTHEFIEQSEVFSVSILSEKTNMELIGTFGFKSGRQINKFEDIKYKTGKTKTPIVLDNTLAYFEARVVNKIDVSTHTIFIGNIEDGEILASGDPMTYEYYHRVKGGYSPKTAPTYSSEIDKKMENNMEGKKMDSYVCEVCGYIYDPSKGDPDNGIAPGTAFEDLPDSWVCPVCGASKDAFHKV